MKQKKLRDAKRKNRLRRLNNWKTGNTKAAKLRKEIRKAARQYSFILDCSDAIAIAVRKVGKITYELAEKMKSAFAEAFADCVPYIPGICFESKEARNGR